MKCELCKQPVQTTFLNKVLGTYVYTKRAKTKTKHVVCPSCQKSLSQEQIMKRLET